jgi:tetratricopeptide (TPR) repeat protein
MKRTMMAVMVLAGFAFGQAEPSASPTPPASASQPAATAPTRGPIQAKTQAEYEAYNTAHAQNSSAAAVEQAANDFAAKFPDSDLRVLLYRDAMHAYQRDNNADKMLEMGRQVLKLAPDDPEAMIGVAEVLTERTQESDLDKQQRLDEAAKLAQDALEKIDTGTVVPAGTSDEQLAAYKSFLRSSAYSVIGTQQYNKENYKDAEDAFRKSIDAYPSQLDPIVVLRLALALDQEKKYAEALKEANRAVDLTKEDTTVGNYARQERDRLVVLNQSAGGAANPTPPGSSVPSAPESKPPGGTAPSTPPKN